MKNGSEFDEWGRKAIIIDEGKLKNIKEILKFKNKKTLV